MKKSISVLVACLMFLGCQTRVSSDLESYLSESTSGTIVDFKFESITDFQWDAMYYFEAAGPFDLMEEITGKNYASYQKKRRLIFMKASKIVYEEELTDTERIGKEFYYYFEEPALKAHILSHQAFGADQVFKIIRQGEKTYCFYPVN